MTSHPAILNCLSVPTVYPHLYYAVAPRQVTVFDKAGYPTLSTRFTGWSRMALPLEGAFRVTEVSVTFLSVYVGCLSARGRVEGGG